MEIADMHCHIIPAVADGATDMEETRAILDIAYKEGIMLMVVTPHYHIGKMKVSSEKLIYSCAMYIVVRLIMCINSDSDASAPYS